MAQSKEKKFGKKKSLNVSSKEPKKKKMFNETKDRAKKKKKKKKRNKVPRQTKNP